MVIRLVFKRVYGSSDKFSQFVVGHCVTDNIKPILGMFCFLFLLTSCFPEITIDEESVLQITNQPIETEGYEALVCRGGLRSKITYPHLDLAVIEQTAPNNSTRQEFFPNQDDQGNDLIYKGMTVQVEAWCYDPAGNEIGYANMVEDFLDSTPMFSLRVYADITPPNAKAQEQCATTLPSFEQTRGNPPCISLF